jgi:hypothetical protein
MKKNLLYNSLIILNILIIIIFLVQYTNATYPAVGHDYRLFISRLIDSHLYYKVNGLSIEWYTPNFGGGLPAYPNPLQMQFSLPQLITWFINPYSAVLISTGIYIAIGFLFTYLFLCNVLELRPLPAILGADLFLINGFLIERVVVGHVNFLTFPLIIIPVYAIFNFKLPSWIAGALISLTGAVLVYSGGVYIAVIGLYSAFIILPLVFFLKPELYSWRKILPVLIWGGILTALLCGSKLYATAAYMRFFPRTIHDQFRTNWITGLGGMIFQLVGTMNFYPILALIHKTSASYIVRLDAWTRTPYGFWELDSSISPALLFLIIYGAVTTLFRKPHVEKNKIAYKKIIAGICLLFTISLVTEFSIAKGILYEQFSKLPVLQSLHANTRFTSAFILPLAIIASKVFDGQIRKWKSGTMSFIAFAVLSGVSLACMWSYYLMPMDVQSRSFDITTLTKTYQRSSAGETFPVNQIVPDMNDYEVFMLHASNTNYHYDPLFRDNNVLLTPLVHEGSVFDVQDGYYNMTDPSSLVYPEANGATLFERIPVSDYWKLSDFINRRPSDWKIPLTQKLLDWVAGLTILIEICGILFFIAKRQILVLQRLHFPPSFHRRHS